MTASFSTSRPYENNLPDQATGPVDLIRPIEVPSGNQTQAGQYAVGTYFGTRVEKTVLSEASQGLRIVTSTHEFFFDAGMPALEGDSLNWLTDGTRYLVTKVFQTPSKAIVQAQYMAAR
jgi:hypothetical protein